MIGSGDALEVTGSVAVAHSGSIDLQGSLKLDSASLGGANGAGITFDGGTLETNIAGFSTSDAVTLNSTGGTVLVDVGAATFSGDVTRAWAASSSQAERSSFPANTYSGATTVEGGTLALSDGGAIASSAVTVESGATFGGEGSAGAVTVESAAFSRPAIPARRRSPA